MLSEPSLGGHRGNLVRGAACRFALAATIAQLAPAHAALRGEALAAPAAARSRALLGGGGALQGGDEDLGRCADVVLALCTRVAKLAAAGAI